MGKNKDLRITASVVLYKTPEDELRKFIECATAAPFTLVYFIDQSPDSSLRSLIEKRDPRFKYFHKKNEGYGRGHNYIIDRLQTGKRSYHLILNCDIEFAPSDIETLIDFMDDDANSDVTLVMPSVLYPSGESQHLCKLLPRPVDIFCRQMAPEFVKRMINKRFTLQGADFSQEMDVPYLSGCFMFFRTEAFLELGGFDPRFFMYFEDTDICRRNSEIGRSVYVPQATITHVHHATQKKDKRVMLIALKSAIQYFNKWGWVFDSQRRRVNRHTRSKYVKRDMRR